MVQLLICLQTERNLLSFSGFYPGERSIFQRINSVIQLSIALIQLVSNIILISLNLNHLDRVIGDSLFMVTHLAFICKLFNFLFNQKRMLLIEEMLCNEIFKFDSEKEQAIIKDSIRSVDFLAKIFRLGCTCVFMFYGAAPFINFILDGEEAKLMLPLPGWLPYEVDNGILFSFTYLIQMSCYAISAFNNSTIDILNCKLMTLATAKFRILEMRLKNIDYEKLGAKASTELKKCIVFRSEILRLTTAIENMFSKGILVQYLASIAVICMTGFQILIVDVARMEFTILIMYFCCMFMQVALYCWYGHNVLVQSDVLTNACYMSNWYISDKNAKKLLFIIMERMKKPVILTAGKFFNLSLITLLAILRSSYSYFTVLRRLYQDK